MAELEMKRQKEDNIKDNKEADQMVVRQGSKLFYCNDLIIDAIRKHDKVVSGLKTGVLWGGLDLIKISKEKMIVLLKQIHEADSAKIKK